MDLGNVKTGIVVLLNTVPLAIWDYDNLAEALMVDLQTTVAACRELEAEGVIQGIEPEQAREVTP